jgi:phage terminase small subunit
MNKHKTELKKLTPKQIRFCEEYLIDLNATQASIRAGYSEKTAYSIGFENLRKPEIQKVLQEMANKVSQNAGVSAEYVLNGLKEVYERCMTKEPVRDSRGDPTGEWKFEHSGANRSLELLGKHLALFTDKTETTIKMEDPIEIQIIQPK